MSRIIYTVDTLRAGQPRAYADSEYEYKITVQREAEWGPNKGKVEPWLLGGDVEAQIRRDEAARAAKTMFGGYSPEQLRQQQREWARSILTALARRHREASDKDGKEGAEAFFWPTLKWLRMDGKAGTIHALIVEPYTD